MKEAEITIGGITLSFAEAMTLRAAVESYRMEMLSDGLGVDKHGKLISESYAKNCKSILIEIYTSIENQ